MRKLLNGKTKTIESNKEILKDRTKRQTERVADSA
jgi:hypothetical protein